MTFVTTGADKEILQRVSGHGQPDHFQHGGPLSSDDRDEQMMVFTQYQNRADAHVNPHGSALEVHVDRLRSRPGLRAGGHELLHPVLRAEKRMTASDAGLVQEHAAVRRVATLTAHAAPTEELFAVVTEEAARLVAADFATLTHFELDGTATTLGAWSRDDSTRPPVARFPVGADELLTIVSESGQPARIDRRTDESGPSVGTGWGCVIRSAAGAPIVIDDNLWGVLTVATGEARSLPVDTDTRLESFTSQAATAIANAESRARITGLASEQAALRRVASLVAQGAQTDDLFDSVTEEVERLLPIDFASLNRFEPDGTPTILAWRSTPPGPSTDSDLVLDGNSISTTVARTHRSARLDDCGDASDQISLALRQAGFRSVIGAPIVVQGQLWGLLIGGSRTAQSLPPDAEARLSSFTDLVAIAIAEAESRGELAASRARIVIATDETRRRIGRDLHDGAQQRLISLGLQIRAAEMALQEGSGEVDLMLSDLADGLVEVQNELMQMARGIYPAILTRGGLAPALKSLTSRTPVMVELDLHVDRRLPERVEVPAYYVVSEALTNAVKHAQASVVHIEVSIVENTLCARVHDDGVGGADPSRGSGLVGLRDRVEASGGTITIQSPRGAGTTIQVELSLDLDGVQPDEMSPH